MLKYVLAFFAFVIFSVAIVNAEEKSWYEIDGIKFRYGTNVQQIWFKTYGTVKSPRKLVKQPFSGDNEHYSQEMFIKPDSQLEGQKTPIIFPITIVLPESLMNSYSFRGAFLDYKGPSAISDIAPVGEINNNNYRQSSQTRERLINEFFNDDDKSFIQGKDNWALSADTDFTYYFVGYYWGLFLPIGEYHRFFKTALGIALNYYEITVKLNLCEEYKVTVNRGKIGDDNFEGYGECTGKREIDSGSAAGYEIAPVIHFNLWQRSSKKSIWSILSVDFSLTAIVSQSKKLNYKYHNNSLFREVPTSQSVELISYTYRF